MSIDSIPQLSLGTAALIIFVICAALVLLRGITRAIINTVVLALSAWLGFLVWQEAPAASIELFGKSVGAITTGLPILVFIMTFIIIRYFLKLITRPFRNDSDDAPRQRSKVSLLFGVLIALIPTSILLVIAIGFIHHSGSVEELKNYATQPKSEDRYSKIIRSMKNSIDQNLPASWLQTLDPLADKSRLALAKLITTQSTSQRTPVIDPKTNEPIPRATIVKDPEVHHLVEEGRFGTLLRHPVITESLNDPKIQSILKNLHF